MHRGTSTATTHRLHFWVWVLAEQHMEPRFGDSTKTYRVGVWLRIGSQTAKAAKSET